MPTDGRTGRRIDMTNLTKALAILLKAPKIISNKSCRKIKTHVLCSVSFDCKLCFNGIMWKNMVQLDRPQTQI